MRKIPWWVWVYVVIGWWAAFAGESEQWPVAWLISVLILVVAYYGEKVLEAIRGK